jgi:Trk-type K+ transport system membrane component
MPPQTRWFIKTSFVYLILSLFFGVILGAQLTWNFPSASINLTPTYIHLLVEGWITMLIIGVVFWMFPKFSLQQPRHSLGLGWASYFLLNLGLLLRLISEPAITSMNSPVSPWSILLTLAAVLQWLGGMAFAFNTWARVKEK